jgi:drug/metabolite transporter (DMT)-like permease
VNNKLKSISFILLSCIAHMLSMAINKTVNPGIPVFLKIFLRMGFGVLFFIPIILQDGWSIFISKKPTLQITRMLLVTTALGATYFTYTQLPFTTAVSLSFTGPIFAAVLSHLILKERLPVGQWIAIVAGYVGVCLMVQPQGVINSVVYVAIAGNIAAGLQLIYIKKLLQVDSGNTIVAIGNVGAIILSALWGGVYWLVSVHEDSLIHITWPDWKDLQLLIVMGLLGTISQLAGVQALKYSSPSFLAPFEYSKLVLAVPIGLILGESLPSYLEMLGIWLILVSIIYSSWQGNGSANRSNCF